MKCAAIKILHNQVTWLRLQVHTGWGHVSTWAKLFRVGNLDLGGVAGKFRLRAGEFKTARLANDTAGAIASHEPSALKRSVAGLNGDAVFGLIKGSQGKPALDRYTQGFRAASQHRFKLIQFRQQTGIGRAGQAVLPLRGVNLAFMKWNAGEVPNLTARPVSGMLVGIFKALMYLQLIEQATAVKRFNRWRRKSPHAERKLLQWRVRILRLLQYQDRAFGQGQFTGEEEAYRPGAGNDDIVDGLMLRGLCGLRVVKRCVQVVLSCGLIDPQDTGRLPHQACINATKSLLTAARPCVAFRANAAGVVPL